MDKSLVHGKIVLCDWLTSGKGAIDAGAVGTVMQDGGYSDNAYTYALPATYLDPRDGIKVHRYLNATRYFEAHNFHF